MRTVDSLSFTLPPEVRDCSAWYGPEVEGWIERFSDAEISEVERAVSELDKSTQDLTSITANEVPLPTLAPRLGGMIEEVMSRRGFVLIRGLPSSGGPSDRRRLRFW